MSLIQVSVDEQGTLSIFSEIQDGSKHERKREINNPSAVIC